MTWDEFKQKVDAGLKAQGKDGSLEISYIDFDGNYEPKIDVSEENLVRVIEGVYMIPENTAP